MMKQQWPASISGIVTQQIIFYFQLRWPYLNGSIQKKMTRKFHGNLRKTRIVNVEPIVAAAPAKAAVPAAKSVASVKASKPAAKAKAPAKAETASQTV